MNERRLLERVGQLNERSARSRMPRYGALTESIVAHLSRILNTREGSVPIDPQFGVPDFTHMHISGGSADAYELVQKIQHVISRYEPRLKHARVTFVQDCTDVLSLQFMIEGAVDTGEREVPVRLMSQLNSEGKISLNQSGSR
ncbi:MAG: type VI secretion system baseplate subunit TssE [Janthinobacterium lividum]